MIKKAGLLAAVIFIVASCAVITVNVYFPEKDVKEAYKDLEKELMKPDSNAAQNNPDNKPESQPQERIPEGRNRRRNRKVPFALTSSGRHMPRIPVSLKELRTQ